MNFIKELADTIFTKESIILPKTPELIKRITTVSMNIHANPEQRKGRTLEQVFKDTKNIAIEDALVYAYPDIFMLNPLEHDKKNPESFAYDLIHKPTGKKIETKRWTQDQPGGGIAVWFSYLREAFKTLFKHIDLVDAIACARIIDHGSHFEVNYLLVADARTFMRYLKPSKYKKDKEDKLVYYHTNAVRNGHCLINEEIQFGKNTAWNSDTQYQYSKSA